MLDKVKNEFAYAIKIPFLRIRYDQINEIPFMINHLLESPKTYIGNNNTFLTNEEYWLIQDDELVD